MSRDLEVKVQDDPWLDKGRDTYWGGKKEVAVVRVK